MGMYIVKDIADINAGDLVIGDNIIIIKDINSVEIVTHLTLVNKDDKIFEFNDLNNLSFEDSMSNNVTLFKNNKKNIFIEYNNKLIYLYSNDEYSILNKNKIKNESVVEHIVKTVKNTEDINFDYIYITKKHSLEFYYYIVFKINESRSIIMLFNNYISEHKNLNKSFSFIIDYDIKNENIALMDKALKSNLVFPLEIIGSTRLSNSLKLLHQINPIEPIKEIHDLYFNLNFNLKDYLRKKIDLTYINKYISNLDLSKIYEYVFEFKNFKSYVLNSVIYVVKDNEIIYDSFFLCKDKNDNLFIDIVKSNTVFIKENEGINPVTGDYVYDGKINNSKISYKDDEGIVLRDTQVIRDLFSLGNYKFFIKKHGYYIQTFNKEEQTEIINRFKLFKKLSDCN